MCVCMHVRAYTCIREIHFSRNLVSDERCLQSGNVRRAARKSIIKGRLRSITIIGSDRRRLSRLSLSDGIIVPARAVEIQLKPRNWLYERRGVKSRGKYRNASHRTSVLNDVARYSVLNKQHRIKISQDQALPVSKGT